MFQECRVVFGQLIPIAFIERGEDRIIQFDYQLVLAHIDVEYRFVRDVRHIFLLFPVVIALFVLFFIVFDIKPRLVLAVLIDVSASLVRHQILLQRKCMHMSRQVVPRLIENVRSLFARVAFGLQWIQLILAKPQPHIGILQLLPRLLKVAVVDLVFLEELLIHWIVLTVV